AIEGEMAAHRLLSKWQSIEERDRAKIWLHSLQIDRYRYRLLHTTGLLQGTTEDRLGMAIIGIHANRAFRNSYISLVFSASLDRPGEYGGIECWIVWHEADCQTCMVDRLVEQSAIVEAVRVVSVCIGAVRSYGHRLLAGFQTFFERVLKQV